MEQGWQGVLRVLRLHRLGDRLRSGDRVDLLQLLAQRAHHRVLAGAGRPQRHRLPHQHRDLLPQLCLHPCLCPEHPQPSLRSLLPQLPHHQPVHDLLVQDGTRSGLLRSRSINQQLRGGKSEPGKPSMEQLNHNSDASNVESFCEL